MLPRQRFVLSSISATRTCRLGALLQTLNESVTQKHFNVSYSVSCEVSWQGTQGLHALV